MQELQSFVRFTVLIIKSGEQGHVYIADRNEKEAFLYLKDKLTKKFFGVAYKEDPKQVKVLHLETRGQKKEEAESEDSNLLKTYFEFTGVDKDEYSIFVTAKTYDAARNKLKALDVFLRFKTDEETPKMAYFFFPNIKTKTVEESVKKNKEGVEEIIANLPVELCEPETREHSPKRSKTEDLDSKNAEELQKMEEKGEKEGI
jgi:hypothetical protein